MKITSRADSRFLDIKGMPCLYLEVESSNTLLKHEYVFSDLYEFREQIVDLLEDINYLITQKNTKGGE